MKPKKLLENKFHFGKSLSGKLHLRITLKALIWASLVSSIHNVHHILLLLLKVTLTVAPGCFDRRGHTDLLEQCKK